MRVGYKGISSQVWSETATLLGPELDAGKDMYLETFGYMYIHGDFLWNISNALGGYKEARFWNFVPYLHAGFFRSYGMDDVDFADNEIAAGGGLLHNLRLARRIDLIVDMRATVVNARVRGVQGIAVLPSVTMGFAVDLGWPDFIRTSTVIAELEAITADQIAALETASLALEVANVALQKENSALKTSNGNLNNEVKQLKSKVNNVYTAADFLSEMGPAMVYFGIGKTVLCEKEMAHMDFIASNIIAKADKETKIVITLDGRADGTTGTMNRNKYLSKARGEYIYKLLTEKYGIDGNRLVVKSEVIAKPAHPELSRAVMISF
jgi:outer membrane protein OmpA-like peptidoglycan-associated protein